MHGSIAILGLLLARQNQDARAEESFRKAIQLAPNYALSHYELGKLLVQSNRLPAAAEELSKAVQYEPNLSAAYYQLSRVYARLETPRNRRASWPNSKSSTSER